MLPLKGVTVARQGIDDFAGRIFQGISRTACYTSLLNSGSFESMAGELLAKYRVFHKQYPRLINNRTKSICLIFIICLF